MHLVEGSLSVRERFSFRHACFMLAPLAVAACMADSPQTDGVQQAVINPPLPSLTLILNAKTALAIGAESQVFGDVAASGPSGTLSFDVGASQSFSGNAIANTVTVAVLATAGHIFGNDITVNGSAGQQTLGVDPAALPQIPAVTPSTPGTTNVALHANQARQLCPGNYGAISLDSNATLNLNGGVYQVTRLTLGDGARLEPSEPVVLLVSGSVTTGTGASIQPSAQSINPMSAGNIRIEVGGAVTLGDNNQVRAHLLVGGKLTTGRSNVLTGAAWAKSIAIGAQNSLSPDGVLSAHTPAVPPPCNDNNACTADQCVGSGTAVAFCSNTPQPAGTSCEDGNTCNGAEACDGAGACLAGLNAPAGTSCSDGDACDGNETCSGSGTCNPGTPPDVNDHNPCTADACDPITGVTHAPLPDGTTCNGVGVCQAGACTVQAHTLFAINESIGHLERIDPATLVVTDIGPLGVPYAFGDCMFNPSDSKLYMVDGRGNFGLYTIDLATGHASLVGLHGFSAMEAIAFHPPTGTIFGMSIDVLDWFSISATTGRATVIGPIGSNFQGMAWDSTRNMMVGFNGSQVFSINVATGAMTFLASTGFVSDFGMTYDPVIDRFWVVDFTGRILQLDPNNGYASTVVTTRPGGRTCVASVPVQ
jgi:hypothetical protein